MHPERHGASQLTRQPPVIARAGLRSIRLELARAPEFPHGSERHGYEFVAPLDRGRRIDLQEWALTRDHCHVRRFWAGEADLVGALVHRPGGGEHAFWAFDWEASPADGGAVSCRFGAHAFVPGEYVTICGPDGEPRSFRVISVSSV